MPQQTLLRCYSRALKEELSKTTSEADLSGCAINHPRILEYKSRLLCGRSQVKDFADWTEFLLKEYGPKQNCLSLGSGIGRVERYLLKIGFASVWETIELNPHHNLLIKRSEDTRIHTTEGDLNFVELKPNTYDFVLCHGILHHLINIEHVLGQINQSLKPDGLLLIYEYVGERRWQFTESRLKQLRKMFPDIRLNNIPVWKVNGFEAVRSDELIRLIEAQFGCTCERSVKYGGVYLPLVTCNWSAARKAIERIVELDAEVSQRNELPPCYHMGLYRKTSSALPPAAPFTDDELQAMLFPPLSAPHHLLRIAHTLKIKVRSNLRVRTRFRSLVSRLCAQTR
jgi:SAM-dependent methyltransferase